MASIVILFVFTQCEKETNVDLKNELSQVNQKLINEVAQMPSQVDQQLAYSLLTPAEKTMLWKQKLANILKPDTINVQQRRHIEKLMSFINISMFENASEKNIKVVTFAKDWCIESLDYFTKEEIIQIAFKISNTKAEKIIPVNKSNTLKTAPGGSPHINCNCCSSSIFSCNSCETPYVCKQIVDCGWLWNSVCDGRCSLAVK